MRRILSLLVMLGLLVTTAPAAQASAEGSRPFDRASVTAVAAVPLAACPKAVNRLLLKAFKSTYKWQNGSAAARKRITPSLLKAQALSGGLVASQIGAIVTYLKQGGTDSMQVLESIATVGEVARLGNC